MSAALFSAIRGARTLLVEKTEYLGGTSALSAGSIWIPNTRHASAVGATDRAVDVERYLQQIVGNHADVALRAAFLKAGPTAVEVLENHSDVKLRAYARHPDYRSELEGAALAGRALEPLPFDGRLLGDAFDLVRPPLPEFTLLGGMMVDRTDIGHLLASTKSIGSLLHSMGLVSRYARDKVRHGRGTRLVMGNALVGRLLHSLMGHDVDIVTGSLLAKIVRRSRGRGVGRDAGIGGRVARDRRQRRADFGGRRFQSPRRNGVPPRLELTPAGPPLRQARTGTRRTRPSRSARASASGISALHSGRPHRSGGAATDRKRSSRISCWTGESRAPSWSTVTAAALSTKRSPITSLRWRCWQTANRPSRHF